MNTITQTDNLWSRKFNLKLFILVLGFLSITSVKAQIDVTATSGTASASYTTLKGAFDAINAGTHKGVIAIGISGATTEGTASMVLNASGVGSSVYTSIVIKPTGGAARTITAATTAGSPMIDLSGADNVKFDGLNTGGNSLTIANTTASASSGTSTIRFVGGATSDTITNCNIQGSFSAAVGTNGGNIFFSTDAVTANGNDNNIISNCNIGPAGSNLSTKGIYMNGSTTTTAIGNSGNTFNNNNIFDYFGAAVTSAGIYITSGNTDNNITNNKFYQTATRTQTTGAQHSAVWITNTSGNNFLVSGNTIGFASSSSTGTYTFVGVSSSVLIPIFLNVGTTTATSVQGNTIAGIAMSGVVSGTSSFAAFRGIYVSSGLATVGDVTGNTIGSMTTTGSITYTSSSTSASDVIGIFNFGSSNFVTNNNKVGGITASNSSTGASNIYGIRCNTGSSVTWACNNNTIGGSVANSINSTSTATGTIVNGILNSNPIGNFINDTIRNMTVAGGTGTTTSASVAGIVMSNAANDTLSRNVIYNLSNSNTSAATVVTGIQFTGSTANLVERNLIYGLTSATNSTSAEINGIRIAGGTTIYRNNMIALGAGVTTAIGTTASNSGTTGINGINEALGTNTIWHNSIYIGGSPTSGTGASYAFNGTQTTNTRSFRDNIFMNDRSNNGATGKNYAVKINGTTTNPTGLTINNNIYYGTGSGYVFGFFNSADVANLAAWKTAVGQDAASSSNNPQFSAATASTPDLHISSSIASAAEASGADVGVTNDYDGQTRSGLTPTDIGADAGNFIALPVCAGTPANSTVNAVASNVCNGSGTTLSLSTNYTDLGITYLWYSSTTSGGPYSTTLGTGATQATGNLTVSTYYICVITCTNSGLSYTTAEKAITVTTPLAGISATGSTTFCAGSGASVTLTENGGNATSWSWSNGGATTQAITVSPTSTTTYTVIATLNGCSATANQTITVNAVPSTVTITPSSASICAGGTQALVASGGTTGAAGNATLGTATTLTGATSQPTAFCNRFSQYWNQTIYTAAELTAAGLSAGSVISSITYTTTTQGDAANNTNFSIRIGNTASSTLSAFQTTGLTTVYGPTTFIHAIGANLINFSTSYTWDGTSNIIIDVRQDGVNSTNNSITYFTAASDNKNFTAVTTTTSATNTIQSLVASASVTGAASTSRLNIILGYSNTQTPTWSWAPSSTLDKSNTASVVSSPIDPSTTYTVTATVGGCTNSNTVTITLSDGATITADPVAVAKCAGQTATFTVAATGQSLTYQWRKDGNNITGNASATTATLTLTNVTAADIATYDVVVSASCGAPATSAAVVLTVTTPLVGINASTTTLCTGNLTSVTLTENGGNATSWSWSNGGATTQAITVSPTVTTTYTVTVMLNGCSATANKTINVNVTPSALTITPPSALICAGGTQALVASGGTVPSNSTATLGTGTTSSTASTTTSALGPNPMQSYYGGSKQQMLVLASELTTLGLSSGSSITSIAFNMSAVESRTLQNYIVKMQHTSTSAFASTAFVTTGFTTVRNAANLTPIVGWNTISLDNSFTWNGTSNLLIEINFSNNDGGGTGTNTALYSTTTFASTLFYRLDNGTSATIDAATTASHSAYTQRNNIQFGYTTTTPGSFTWAPSTTLNTSTGASVTASPTSQTTYTVTSTINGCANSSTVTVGISTGPAITTDPVATAKCAGQTATFTVVASGQSLTYQWRKGGVNINTTSNTSAATATLTLTNVSATDNANYDVVVTAACGSPVTSAAVALTVTTPLAGISATAATICSGSSTTLTENGGNATSWSWSNGATTQAITVSPTSTTSYTVTATFNGCSTTATQSITVNPSPTAATATPSVSTVCAGVAFNLSSTPSIASSTILTEGFETGATGWSFQDSSSTGTSIAGQIWHIQGSPYNDATGSITFSGFSISGSNFAYANADAGGTGSQTNTFMNSPSFSTVGYTGTATLTFKNLYRYYSASSPIEQVKVQITKDGGATWTDLVNYSGASVGTTTNNAEVATTSTVTIPSTFIGQPSIKLRWRYLSNWGYVWAVDDISLTGTPIVYTYSWASSPAGYTASTQNPTGITQTAATAYTVTVSLGSCSTTATANVGLTASSVAPTGATGTTTICNGNSTTLTVTGGTLGSGAVVEWFTGSCGGTSAGTGSSITVSPTSTTTYYVRYNGTCNTTSCATVTVTVNQPSVAPTGTTGTTTICNGNSTTLTVAGGTVGTGVVVEWFTGSCGGASAGTGNSITVSPTSTTTYYVRYNGTCNTTSCATVTVTVNQPSAASNANVSICPGSSYVFNNTTYTTAGTHTATFTNAAGCDSTVTVNISIHSPLTPTVTISTAKDTICNGGITTFTASSTNGGVSPSFEWFKNGQSQGIGNGSITFGANTLSSGTNVFSCVMTATNLCLTTSTANSNTVVLFVKQSPLMGTSTISVGTLCTIGATTNVYNSNTQGGGVWTSKNPAVATVSTVNGGSGVVTTTGFGVDTLTYTKSFTNGCSESRSTTLSVVQATSPGTITGSNGNSICKGSTTTLGGVSGGVWSTPSTSIASVNNSGVVTGNSAGTATIVYTINTNGCIATSTYNVIVNPIPTIPSMGYVAGTPNPQTGTGGAFCVGKSFKVVGTSPIAPVVPNLTGVWSSSDTSLVSINATGSGNNKDTALVVIKAPGSGVTLTYKVTSPAGCTNNRTVTLSTSIICPFSRGVSKEELMTNNVQFTMYPNPARSTVSLQVDKLVGTGSIMVTDLYGKQVKTQALSMGNNTVDVSTLSKGFYLVSVITTDGKTTKKLVVE